MTEEARKLGGEPATTNPQPDPPRIAPEDMRRLLVALGYKLQGGWWIIGDDEFMFLDSLDNLVFLQTHPMFILACLNWLESEEVHVAGIESEHTRDKTKVRKMHYPNPDTKWFYGPPAQRIPLAAAHVARMMEEGICR